VHKGPAQRFTAIWRLYERTKISPTIFSVAMAVEIPIEKLVEEVFFDSAPQSHLEK